MCDPRRTIVTYSGNSNSVRARKWYRVAEVCEFDGSLYMHRDYVQTRAENMPGINGASPHNRADAIRQAKAYAAASGFSYAGIFVGVQGYPMRKA